MRGFAPGAQEKVRQEIQAVCDTNKVVAQGTHGSCMMTGNTELRCSRARGERKEARKEAVTREGREVEWSVRGLEARLTATHRVRVVASRSRLCELPTMGMGEGPGIALVKVMTSHYEVTEAVDNVLSIRPWPVLLSSCSSDCVVVSRCAGRDVIVHRLGHGLVAVGVSM